MAILCILFSAMFTALGNFLIRRGLDQGDPFILPRFLTAGLMALGIIYFQNGTCAIDAPMALVAVVSGLFLGLLQHAIGKSLLYGPSSLTFVFVTSVCVLPPVCMFFLFGKEFGHDYTIYNLIGSLLVVAGLYWMGKTNEATNFVNFKKWLRWIATAFIGLTLYYLILQWRALMLQETLPDSLLLPFRGVQVKGDLFIPISFFAAALTQLIFGSSFQVKRQLLASGIFAGIVCSISTFLLVLGTEFAAEGTENALLFPLNTILLVSLCNVWATLFYKERVNWPANALSATGIIIAAI